MLLAFHPQLVKSVSQSQRLAHQQTNSAPVGSCMETFVQNVSQNMDYRNWNLIGGSERDFFTSDLQSAN